MLPPPKTFLKEGNNLQTVTDMANKYALTSCLLWFALTNCMPYTAHCWFLSRSCSLYMQYK